MSMDLQTDRALAYRIRVPSVKPRRLLILSHGVGGNETNLLPLAGQAPEDTVVVLPRGPESLNANQHAWFQVSFGPHGPKPDLVAAEASRKKLVLFVTEMQSMYRIPAADTVLAGFSQGGIISASVALTRPELVGGFGVLAGRILPELKPQLADRGLLRELQAFIGHGRDDTKLPIEWARRADTWLTELGVPHETHFYPGDHGIPLAMQDDLFAWFERTTADRGHSQGE